MIIEKYYFLFFLGLIWISFAAIQDIRKREVANWLNYSLIGFALAYRAFFSVLNKDAGFFVYGIVGFAVFFGLAYGFYYGKVFAGGDAKLLMGVGALIPFESINDFVILGGGFLLVLFIIGGIYTLIYSLGIAIANFEMFREHLKIKKYYLLFVISGIAGIFALMMADFLRGIIFFAVFEMLAFIYVFVKAVDKCMIRLKKAGELQEGDWIENDIKLKNYTVKKTVHGLSMEDIKRLRKAKKQIMVKEGIPFIPVFLMAFLVMGFFLVNGLYYRIWAYFAL